MMRFRFMVPAVAGVVVALACGTAFAQKLYKHVDEKGVVTYTDIPDKPKDTPMGVGNVKRNGDRTENINSNMSRMSEEEQRAWNRKQAQQRSAAERLEAEERAKNAEPSEMERIAGPIYKPSTQKSTTGK